MCSWSLLSSLLAYNFYIISLQNFLALCASNYYNGCLFHRNIKGFIVQTGDPTNTGKGGTSIWGSKFPDEFKENLKVCAIIISVRKYASIQIFKFWCIRSILNVGLFRWRTMDRIPMVVNFSSPTLHIRI